MAKNSASGQRRAELRREQERQAQQARRKQKMLWVVLGALLLTVVAVVVLVLVQNRGGHQSSGTSEQLTPPNATKEYGIKLVSKKTQPASGVPHLVIWEDSQCPACKAREQHYGPAIKELVDQGKITAEIRTAHFLDAMIGNDSSQRAAQAAAAADLVGMYREYHDALFAHQPQEGKGFTEEQLRVEFAKDAGITGDKLQKFQQAYDGKAFTDFVKKANEQFYQDKIQATPTYSVNGKTLEFVKDDKLLIQPTADDMLRAIKELSGK